MNSSVPSRHVLFASIPFVGHLNPLLHQGEELARRGWRVSVASFEHTRDYIEKKSSSVSFISLGPPPGTVEAYEEFLERVSGEPSVLKGSIWILQQLGKLWPGMYDGLLREVRKNRPDVMVVDFASTAGIDVAEQEGIPFVVNNADLLTVLPATLLPHAGRVPPLLSGYSVHSMGPWQRMVSYISRIAGIALAELILDPKTNALRKSRSLPAIDTLRRLRGRTILVNGAFGLEYTRPLPRWIHMVGPMLPVSTLPLSEEWQNWLEEGLPVVYVNLGTLSSPSQDQLARLCAGLGSGNFRVLMVLRPAAQLRLPAPLPGHIRVESWIPSPLAILGHGQVRAFVSHCGVNSVHESLAAGKPVVGIPMFAAQEDMGMRVRDTGAGIVLNKNTFTGEELHKAIQDVMTDMRFRSRIFSIQESFRLAGGVNHAADLIEEEADLYKHRLTRRPMDMLRL